VSETGTVLTTCMVYPYAGPVVAERNGSPLYYLHREQLDGADLTCVPGSVHHHPMSHCASAMDMLHADCALRARDGTTVFFIELA